jgi:hypothetical protein
MNQIGQTFLIFATGLVGGLVGSMLFGPSPAEVDSGANTGVESVLTSDRALAEKLDGIQDELDRLGQDMSMQGTSLQALDSRIAALQDMRRDLLAGSSLGAGTDPLSLLDPAEIPSGMAFDAAVNAAIEKREADVEAERSERRSARRKEQLDRQMERFTEELGLDAVQADQMRTILDETSRKRNAFFSEMRDSGVMDRDLIRRTMTELNDSVTEQLGDVLTTDQMDKYSELNASRFGGPGPGGGGGGRGSGGS